MKKFFQIPLWTQVIIAIIAALIVGFLLGPQSPVGLAGSKWSATAVYFFDFIGELFLRALKMLVVPLIASAIVTAVAGMGQERSFARLGIKTLAFYMGTSLLAVLTGLLLVNFIQPGVNLDLGKMEHRQEAMTEDEIAEKVGGRSSDDFLRVFQRMVPDNIVEAAGDNGALLSVIFFALLFGYFLCASKESKGIQTVKYFWEGLYEIMLNLTHFVMRFAPIGVFGLVAEVTAHVKLDGLTSLLWYFLTVLLALAVHTFVTLPLLLWLVGGISPRRHFAAMFPALLTAFSTSSSSATLPITMECTRQRAGVSKRVSDFVLPLGATVNMNGTALYECVVVIFFAQVYGMEMNFVTQFYVIMLALMTSVGVAGVPSASLVAIVVIMRAVGLPLEGIGFILLFDRPLDMLRTSVNIFGDSCVAVMIGRTEGETKILSKNSAGN